MNIIAEIEENGSRDYFTYLTKQPKLTKTFSPLRIIVNVHLFI